MSLKEDLAALGRSLVVVVGGGRDYKDHARVWWALDGVHVAHGIARLAHGGARGADTLAGEWAREVDVDVEVFAAEWERLGKRAGFVRNEAMLDAVKPDLVIAFEGGKGTDNLVTGARSRGLRVWRVKP